MNRTAVDIAKSLRGKLIRLAYAHPEKRAAILPLLTSMGVTAGCEKLPEGGMRDNCEKKVEEGKNKDDKKASLEKAAKEQEDFQSWVVSTQSVMNPQEVQGFVEHGLKVKTSPPVGGGPKGPRYKRGDLVEICAGKHTDHATLAPYQAFNGKTGTVVEIDGVDVLVAIEGEPAPVRFPKGMKPRGVGIYKFTAAYILTGSPAFEMYYKASGDAGESFEATAYLGRARGTEKRSGQYYTGHVVFASTGANGWYFRGFPQQRMRVEGNSGCSQGGYRPTTFNPESGRVLYIGLLGHRPGDWKKQLKALKEEASAQEMATAS